MAANSPLLKPLGILAGGLGSFQAITWGILSLLGILTYTTDITPQTSVTASNEFQRILVHMYFVPSGTGIPPETVMTPGTVVVWTSFYFATSVIWLVVSGFLLYDSYKSKFTYDIINRWVTATAVVAAIDFAGTIAFGVDYGRLKSELDKLNVTNPFGTGLLLAPPIFMMLMCARGFVLWIMNVGLVICLRAAARNLNKTGSPNLLQEPEKLRHQPSFNSHYYNSMGANLYSSPTVDSSNEGRQNSTFQPDPIYAWDTLSPTVGKQQPSRRDFPPKNTPCINDMVNPITPIPPITHVRKPVAPPGALVLPPHPDYSPPTLRPVKHEPHMYEAPIRSVLKNSNAQRRTYF